MILKYACNIDQECIFKLKGFIFYLINFLNLICIFLFEHLCCIFNFINENKEQSSFSLIISEILYIAMQAFVLHFTVYLFLENITLYGGVHNIFAFRCMGI